MAFTPQKGATNLRRPVLRLIERFSTMTGQEKAAAILCVVGISALVIYRETGDPKSEYTGIGIVCLLALRAMQKASARKLREAEEKRKRDRILLDQRRAEQERLWVERQQQEARNAAARERERVEYQKALLDFRWHERMSPTEFERCCADYLNLRGWVSETTKGSGDQGADVLARKAGHLLVLQCKKYAKPIGNKAVQEVISAKVYKRATSAAVVSNQPYTPAARELAQRAGVLLLHFSDLRNIDRLLGLPERFWQDPSSHAQNPNRRASTSQGATMERVIRPCPTCSTKIRLPTGKSGKVRCPSCQFVYTTST